MKFSLIVPCYNEQDNIKNLVAAFDEFANDYDFELILVDNGSKDDTEKLIDAEIAAHSNNMNYIKKAKVDVNCGYGNGILTGLAAGSGDYLGWIHADLQSSPSVFKGMMESALKESGDFLYKGARTNRDFTSRFFTKGMALYESMLFGMKLEDCNSQPTMLSRHFYESWANPPKDFSLDIYAYTLAYKRGIKIARFESPQSVRAGGESSWNDGLKSRIKMAFRVMDYSKNVKKLLKDEV